MKVIYTALRRIIINDADVLEKQPFSLPVEVPSVDLFPFQRKRVVAHQYFRRKLQTMVVHSQVNIASLYTQLRNTNHREGTGPVSYVPLQKSVFRKIIYKVE